MRYRKRPIEVSAKVNDMSTDLFEWLEQRGCPFEIGSDCLSIGTLEGYMAANVGDYIIQGVRGEFYPCKPDIFEVTYEPVRSQN